MTFNWVAFILFSIFALLSVVSAVKNKDVVDRAMYIVLAVILTLIAVGYVDGVFL